MDWVQEHYGDLHGVHTVNNALVVIGSLILETDFHQSICLLSKAGGIPIVMRDLRFDRRCSCRCFRHSVQARCATQRCDQANGDRFSGNHDDRVG